MLAYILVKKNILEYIKEKGIAVGDRLPSEVELATELGVSRLTLREALSSLREDGIIYSAQGKGTFLACNTSQISDTLNNNLGITEMILAAGFKPGVKFMEKALVKADEVIANHLSINVGSDVLVYKRIRTADEKPVVYTIDHFAPQIAAKFLTINDESISIYDFIEEQCNIQLGNSMAEIFPIKCPPDLAEKFSYNEGDPLLGFKQVISDLKGSPLIYAIEYFRPDCFKFFINRRRMKT